jgi:hypothetical protein
MEKYDLLTVSLSRINQNAEADEIRNLEWDVHWKGQTERFKHVEL